MYIVLYILFICVTLQVIVAQGQLFSVSQLCCILFGSTPWMGNSTVAGPLPKNDKTNKDLTYMNSCQD